MPHVVPLSMLVATNRPTTGERCVGRTHTTVRLQTRIRRKDGTENFAGFVYVLDGFLQWDIVSWVFMCPINFIVFFRLSRPGLSHLYHHCTAITPVYIYISRLSLHSLVISLGYHTRAITLHHTRTSGYHTRHS